MSWIAVRVRPAANRDEVIAALFGAGSQGVQEDGDTLLTHYPPDADVPAIRRAVAAVDVHATVEIGTTPDVDWSEAWRDRITLHALGALTVAPPWLADGLDPACTIVIDPGMAFGTGEHATTRGVVRLMQAVLRPGDTVADLGAGSAVLAIAAAKLGAARVAAIELDADAIGNAMENVRRNGVQDVVHVIEGDAATLLALVAPVRVVLANIVSSVLLALLPGIESALSSDGRAILSGMLRDERAEMIGALRGRGWRIEAEDSEEIWWSVSVARA